MAEGLEKQAGGRAAVLAWGMCVFALAVIFASLVLALLGTARVIGLDFPLVGVSGALVGGLVASRKPCNPVGWFFWLAPDHLDHTRHVARGDLADGVLAGGGSLQLKVRQD